VTTVADLPAAATYQSHVRAGFKLPGSARKFAMHCIAEGITSADIRADAVEGDMLLTELAGAMADLEDKGLTQAKCRFLLDLDGAPVPAQRTAGERS
jgi:hypothetical protein